MAEIITAETVQEAFDEAKMCMGAEQCILAGKAMCLFYKLDNQRTIETGKGMITFASPPDGPCPNIDQLFCRDVPEQPSSAPQA